MCDMTQVRGRTQLRPNFPRQRSMCSNLLRHIAPSVSGLTVKNKSKKKMIIIRLILMGDFPRQRSMCSNLSRHIAPSVSGLSQLHHEILQNDSNHSNYSNGVLM